MEKLRLKVTPTVAKNATSNQGKHTQITVLGLPEHASGQHRSTQNASLITFEIKGQTFKLNVNDTHGAHWKHQADKDSFTRLFRALATEKNVGKELLVEASVVDGSGMIEDLVF